MQLVQALADALNERRVIVLPYRCGENEDVGVENSAEGSRPLIAGSVLDNPDLFSVPSRLIAFISDPCGGMGPSRFAVITEA